MVLISGINSSRISGSGSSGGGSSSGINSSAGGRGSVVVDKVIDSNRNGMKKLNPMYPGTLLTHRYSACSE